MGAAGASVVGCGASEEEQRTLQGTRPAPEETPRHGGRLQYATDVNFISIDPHLTVGSGIWIIAWIYSYLFHYSGTLPEVILWDTAKEMEQPDEVTYRFSLRGAVRTPRAALWDPRTRSALRPVHAATHSYS